MFTQQQVNMVSQEQQVNMVTQEQKGKHSYSGTTM